MRQRKWHWISFVKSMFFGSQLATFSLCPSLVSKPFAWGGIGGVGWAVSRSWRGKKQVCHFRLVLMHDTEYRALASEVALHFGIRHTPFSAAILLYIGFWRVFKVTRWLCPEKHQRLDGWVLHQETPYNCMIKTCQGILDAELRDLQHCGGDPNIIDALDVSLFEPIYDQPLLWTFYRSSLFSISCRRSK